MNRIEGGRQSNKLTRAAYAFLFVKVKHRAVRTIVFDLLIALTPVVRGAAALWRRVVELVGMAALVVDAVGARHLHHDR